MTQEYEEPEVDTEAETASEEEANVESNESEQEAAKEQTVPLSALTAERKKRQELENQSRLLAEYVQSLKNGTQGDSEEEDPDDWATLAKLKQTQAQTRQEIVEEVYKDSNPTAVQEINKYIDLIIEKKPWLVDSIRNAPNRIARAYEVVNDYKHLVEPKKQPRGPTDAERIAANAKKPGTPVGGKTANLGGAEYLKSIQGTKEFREYRNKIRYG